MHLRATRRALRPLVGLLAAIGVIAALGACGGSAKEGGTNAVSGQTVDTAPASSGGTLRLARSLEPVTLNPLTCGCENGSWQTIVQLYDTLVEFMPGTTDIAPGLAKSWDVSADKKTFTFHLRRAQFSDGTPVTVDDVKYSLERAADPRAPYYQVFSVIDEVTAPDASTIVVQLKRPTIGFLWYAGFPAAAVVPKSAIERAGDDAFGRRPIGSGAFMLKRWVKGQVVELVRNPHYWRRGQPYLDGVTMLYVPNDNTRTLDLISGNVDAVDAVPFSQVDQVNSSGQARARYELSSGSYNVWFNERAKPLQEKAVRQALNYATPLREIRTVVFRDQSEIANGVLPKLKAWSASVRPYDLDLAKARALMARSSSPGGFSLTIDVVSGDDTSKQVVQILQDAWSKIGVDVKVRQSDFGSVYTRIGAFEYQAFMFPPDAYTSDLPIQDEFAKFTFNDIASPLHNAWTWYDNPTAARLADDAIHAPDEATQVDLYAQLQRVTMEDPPAVPLIFPPYRPAARTNVHGYQYVQTGWWRLEQVSLAR
jgi:peptide/nickel transport system substrate-binding protein